VTGYAHRVDELLNREVPGNLDLRYYTASDIYWEIVRPREDLFAGCRERDLRAAVQRWVEEEMEEDR